MYKHRVGGGFLEIGTGRNIPEDPENRDYQKVLAWASIDGNEIGAADPDRVLTYRERRANAYIGLNASEGLAKDIGNTIRTLGDVLDVLISEVVARGPAVNVEFQEMIAKIAAIKIKYPKP